MPIAIVPLDLDEGKRREQNEEEDKKLHGSLLA
jgi:hypothetical protein